MRLSTPPASEAEQGAHDPRANGAATPAVVLWGRRADGVATERGTEAPNPRGGKTPCHDCGIQTRPHREQLCPRTRFPPNESGPQPGHAPGCAVFSPSSLRSSSVHHFRAFAPTNRSRRPLTRSPPTRSRRSACPARRSSSSAAIETLVLEGLRGAARLPPQPIRSRPTPCSRSRPARSSSPPRCSPSWWTTVRSTGTTR